jgi:uncharacterized phage protein (TIGR02220 family)
MAVPNLTIEGVVWGAWEYQSLQEALGLPKRADAIGRMASLWQWCLTEETDVAPAKVVDAHLGRGGAEAIVECDLGELVDGGIRIRGTQKRIAQWQQRQTDLQGAGRKRAAEAQRKGGRFLPSDDCNEDDQVTSIAPARHQHATSDSPASLQHDTSLDQPSPSLSPSASPSPPVQAEPPKPPKGGSRRSGRSGVLTPAARAAAGAVLRKLGEQTGIEYRGAEKHVAMIIGRYRDGFDELDLRKVIAYASRTKQEGGLGWNADEKMRMFLRPETLFGPETIERYADAARSWFKQRIAAELQPSPEFNAWRAEQAPRLAVVK